MTYPDGSEEVVHAKVTVLDPKTIRTIEQDDDGNVKIIFTDGTEIVIPAGKDGKPGDKGEPGKDGQNGADGKDGQNGDDGKDGQNGADGKSAFDIWKEQPGNENKTLDDFLKETRGKDGADGKDGQKGDKGEPGKDGRDGTNGRDGKDGINGKDGAAGESAFDIWKKQPGNENKTMDDFLKTINGKDGKDGKDGRDGRGIQHIGKDRHGNTVITLTDGTQFVLDGDKGMTREDLARELENRGLVSTTTNNGNVQVIDSKGQAHDVNTTTRGVLASTGASVAALAAMALLSLIGGLGTVFVSRKNRRNKQ